MSELYHDYCTAYRLTPENSHGFFDVAGPLYYSDEVQSLEQYEQHLEINRLQHITSVAYIAYRVCQRRGLDAAAAARAATMHDLFYYDWRDGETGRWHKLHGYKHPHYAAMNAKELYPALTKKEEDIIRRHMWPLTLRLPNSREGFVVSLSDKYCAARELVFSLSKRYKARFERDLKRV